MPCIGVQVATMGYMEVVTQSVQTEQRHQSYRTDDQPPAVNHQGFIDHLMITFQ